MAKDWENRKDRFEVVDVRKLTGNFLPGLLNKAGQVEVGDGMCVAQSFEPIPLYSAMADLGFDHLTEMVSDSEYRVYFYRVEKKEAAFTGVGDMPLKPTAYIKELIDWERFNTEEAVEAVGQGVPPEAFVRSFRWNLIGGEFIGEVYEWSIYGEECEGPDTGLSSVTLRQRLDMVDTAFERRL